MNPKTSVSIAWDKIQGMLNGLIVMLPNIVLALIVFTLFFFAARAIKSLVKHLTRKYRHARNLGLVLGRLSQGIVIGSLRKLAEIRAQRDGNGGDRTPTANDSR